MQAGGLKSANKLDHQQSVTRPVTTTWLQHHVNLELPHWGLGYMTAIIGND